VKTLGTIARSWLLLTGTRVFGQDQPTTDANLKHSRDEAIAGERLVAASSTAFTAADAKARRTYAHPLAPVRPS